VPAAKSPFAGTMPLATSATVPAPVAPTQQHVVIQAITGAPPRIVSGQGMQPIGVMAPPPRIEPPQMQMQPMQPQMQPMQPLQPQMQPMQPAMQQPMMMSAAEPPQPQPQGSRTLLWAVIIVLALSLVGAAGAAIILMSAK